MGIAVRIGFAGAALCVLAACGGGGGGGSATPLNAGDPGAGGTYTPGVFPPRADFAGQCTAFNEKMFLRSWTNDLYLWFAEVPDTNPNSIADVIDYFDALKTPQLTPSSSPKDRFHFDIDTDELRRAVAERPVDRLRRRADDHRGRSAAAARSRRVRRARHAGGQRGRDARHGGPADQQRRLRQRQHAGWRRHAERGVLPVEPPARRSRSVFRPPGGAARQRALTTANITHKPVLLDTTLTQGADTVGYMVFNDHIATAEKELVDAITRLQTAGVDDLILDIRYNGGGFLDIASELAYMIAGPGRRRHVRAAGVQQQEPESQSGHRTGRCARRRIHTTTQDFSLAAGHAAADAESEPRLRHHRAEHVLGERVDHQRPARRRRAGVPDRLDHLRQAVRVLSAGQLRHHVLLDPVPGRERDELRRLPGRLRAATTRAAPAA